MDSNYASAGGGVGVGGGGASAKTAVGTVAGANSRYSAYSYKDPAASCQRGVAYNTYDPYGGSVAGVRASSVYPYDAEAEFKERTGMGKSKTAHLQMAGSGTMKMQPQHAYNPNSCYGSYPQNSVALTPESNNYYAYAYDQHHHYSQQQQQQQQQYHHQSALEQQYKYGMNAKVAAEQHQHQQQHQSALKMSPPEYGYAPYHHVQHPYYHPHYHHISQKGGVGVMKDANSMPYVNSKMLHSTSISSGGGGRGPQYPANYSYHPHSYQPAVGSAGHHTYQSQSICDDGRWMWNSGGGGVGSGGGTNTDYQSSCRSAYPAYVNNSAAKQTNMWPTMPMQYQNTMSTGYPAAAAVTNQSCCPSTQSAASNYYPQQYVKYPQAMDYDGSQNDLYSNSQVSSILPAGSASTKVYTDLNAQPQANSYQTMNTTSASYHQPGSCNSSSTALDYNQRYLQQQHTESPSSSSNSSTSSYSHHYYHNLHPYGPQAYAGSEAQEPLFSQQQVDTKIGLTTKSQSLRDFLTTWNEDEDECSDRTMSSTDVPFIEQLHLPTDHQLHHQAQEQQQQQHIVENHLQFKGSFTTRPKIHVGITVDSTVESDQYINLPDIIIDIEKSNKDMVSVPEGILSANITKVEKEEVTIKEEKHSDVDEPAKSIQTTSSSIPKKTAELTTREKRKFRRKFLRCKRIAKLQKLRLVTQRNQRKPKVPRPKLMRPKIPRVKKSHHPTQSRLQFNPQSLKCLCVSLINSDKFRNRILGPSEIDSLLNLTTDNEVNIDVAVALSAIADDPAGDDGDAADNGDIVSPSVIPKLSDLCKNALNSSFDRDVLVINLDEILDSDNLFVVQCDINENILENYVDQQLEQDDENANADADDDNNNNSISSSDLVEILNDNNNNYNSGRNYISTTSTLANRNSHSSSNSDIVTPAIEEQLKRCCSVTEVSNLPLDNAVEHNNLNSSTNRLSSFSTIRPAPAPPSPSSSSCPASLCCYPSLLLPSLIEQNCTTQQITVGHEQLHEMLMLSDIVNGNDNENDGNNRGVEDEHHHHLHHDDVELLMLTSEVATPSIHHEEIVPDNLKKFQNEKFLKYLHAKYVQGNLSQFYHANRIIKKYKKRIIKKILNIVR